MKQQALAEKLGVTKQAVSLWERGHCNPRDSHLDKLCVLFGWDYEEWQAVL